MSHQVAYASVSPLQRLIGVLAVVLLASGCGIRPRSGFSGSNVQPYGSAQSAGTTAIVNQLKTATTSAGVQSALTAISNRAQSLASSVHIPPFQTVSISSANSADAVRGAERSLELMPIARGVVGANAGIGVTSVPTLQASPRVAPGIDLTGICGEGNYADLWLPGIDPDPALGGKYPLLIVVHGGAWRGDGRQYMAPGYPFPGGLDMVTPALYHGMAVVNIDYGPAAPAANLQADVVGALCQVAVFRLVGQFGLAPISTQRIVALGHSAGGHIVSFLAALGGFAGLGSLQGAIVLAGVSDLTALFSQLLQEASPSSIQAAQVLDQTFGGTPADQGGQYALWSPLFWEKLNHGSFAAVQWWHGTGDTLVPDSQCQVFAQNGSQGTTCTLLNEDHGFGNPDGLQQIYDQGLGPGGFAARAFGYN